MQGSYFRRGFTIVELLIVIVVIGILAAITIVAYNGISTRANDASARSASQQAAKAIVAYSVVNSDTFPSTLSDINVNSSGGTSFSYSVDNSSNPKLFCVSASVGGISYYVNNGDATQPTLGTCLGLPTVTTLAGSGVASSTNGTGTAATINAPYGLALYSGNIYIAERGGNLIRRATTAGVVTTFAGSGTAGNANGTGTAAQFSNPARIYVDSSGNFYVADSYNHRMRKITSGGVVTTFAGSSQGYLEGTGTAAQFNFPFGVASDQAGNIYVADTYNNRIRKVTTSGVTSIFAGSGATGVANGTGTAAQFNLPRGMVTDSSGNLYVADMGNDRIRKITPAGVVTTYAGSTTGYLDAIGTAAQFNTPEDITIDPTGNLYVADSANDRIRKITPAGVVTTIAGSSTGYLDGVGTNSRFNYPSGIVFDPSSNIIYVADYNNNRIRKLQ